MTHDEMLELAAEAENWTDAADWKDNCSRLNKLLQDLPQLIAEYHQFRNFAVHVADGKVACTGAHWWLRADANGLLENDPEVLQKYMAV